MRLHLIRCIGLVLSFAAVIGVRGQGGLANFQNTSATLISANGVPMPVNGTQPFILAIFVAPSSTVTETGITPAYSDPVWQVVGGYNTNSATTPGRITSRIKLDVGAAGGFGDGSTVDFLIRAWSANAGVTWAEALTSWNNGSPQEPMYIGSSTIGNDFWLSFEFTGTVFGLGPDQVGGFNIVGVPEPSTLALVGLGAAAFWFSRRRSP